MFQTQVVKDIQPLQIKTLLHQNTDFTKCKKYV